MHPNDDDPLAAYTAENPVPHADAYADAYFAGAERARHTASYARILLAGFGEDVAEIYVDDFAARYASIYLTAFPASNTN